MSNSDFLTMKDLMSRYQVSKATINNWRNAGLFPQGMKVSKVRRWNIHDIESWEAEHLKEVN